MWLFIIVHCLNVWPLWVDKKAPCANGKLIKKPYIDKDYTIIPHFKGWCENYCMLYAEYVLKMLSDKVELVQYFVLTLSTCGALEKLYYEWVQFYFFQFLCHFY